jgi:hypothetical protein
MGEVFLKKGKSIEDDGLPNVHDFPRNVVGNRRYPWLLLARSSRPRRIAGRKQPRP